MVARSTGASIVRRFGERVTRRQHSNVRKFGVRRITSRWFRGLQDTEDDDRPNYWNEPNNQGLRCFLRRSEILRPRHANGSEAIQPNYQGKTYRCKRDYQEAYDRL